MKPIHLSTVKDDLIQSREKCGRKLSGLWWRGIHFIYRGSQTGDKK